MFLRKKREETYNDGTKQGEQDEDENKKRKSFKRTILEYAVTLIICFVSALLIRNYVIARADVDGDSMNPTLKNRDIVFVEKISTLTEKFSKGNIVIFDSHDEKEQVYIKRVIAVAGDKVELKDGKVYVNDKELKEDYLPEGTVTQPHAYMPQNKSVVVPEGDIFVMGDNRMVSKDSRDFGPIKLKDIKGRALIRVLPIKSFKFL